MEEEVNGNIEVYYNDGVSFDISGQEERVMRLFFTYLDSNEGFRDLNTEILEEIVKESIGCMTESECYEAMGIIFTYLLRIYEEQG